MTIYGLLMPESEGRHGASDPREDGSIHGDAASEA